MKKIKKIVRKLTGKQIDKIWSLSEKGLSQRAVAKKIGCNKSTVGYWLNK